MVPWLSTLSSSAFGTFILHLVKSASTWLPDLLLKTAFTRVAPSLHFLEILLALIPCIFHLHLSPPTGIKLLFHIVKNNSDGLQHAFYFLFQAHLRLLQEKKGTHNKSGFASVPHYTAESPEEHAVLLSLLYSVVQKYSVIVHLALAGHFLTLAIFKFFF